MCCEGTRMRPCPIVRATAPEPWSLAANIRPKGRRLRAARGARRAGASIRLLRRQRDTDGRNDRRVAAGMTLVQVDEADVRVREMADVRNRRHRVHHQRVRTTTGSDLTVDATLD